jgi:hypothetical protein
MGASRKTMTKDAAAPSELGGGGVEAAEEHVEVVRFAAAIDVGQGVRDGVHPGAGQPR